MSEQQPPYGPPSDEDAGPGPTPRASPYAVGRSIHDQPGYAQPGHDPSVPGYAGGQPGSRPGLPRPGAVTAAAVITLVLAGITLLILVLVGIGVMVSRELFVGELSDSEEFASGATPNQVVAIVMVFVSFFALWSAASMVMAVKVLRGSRLARTLLTISSGVTALVSLLAIMSLVSGITLIGAIVVVVLLWTGDAGPWFASQRRGGHELPLGTTQPWG